LIDASTCWDAGGETHSRSGPWIEQIDDGSEVTLEAVALNAGGQAILLLERLGEVFEAKKSMSQKARETVIAYQRFNSEMQKKEILLSCIADEMNAALANTITSLRLMELEQSPERIRQLLGLASRATEEQQSLINKVLHVFADELEELYGHNGSGQEAKLDDALKAADLDHDDGKIAEMVACGQREVARSGASLRVGAASEGAEIKLARAISL
jgi:signal transduction histidine kinase